MESHGQDDLDLKAETAQVWSESVEQDQNTTQVHFVPDNGTVAQIVYSDDQDRPTQQVVYTADGTSYTSVDTSEHTLVYIHPVEATQTLFTDPSQVTYVQQDAETQQVWYAASYAEFVNQKIHDVSEEERKVLREQEKNWPCYECNRRFMSSEQLQQHLNSHDEKLDFFSRARGRGRGRGKRRFGPGRRPGRPPKFMRLEVTTENGGKCAEESQDLLPFASKGQFDEAGPATLNGLDQPEETPVAPEASSSLDQLPESQSLQLQPHEQTVVATPSLMTADDMRRAKRIRNAALQHLFIRKSFRPFKCLHCGKAFRDKDKLDQHLRFHGREGNCPLTCDICNKGFINSSALESHMKFHLDQKTYSCIFCPESFDRLDLLKDHVAIHINDGCFTCPTCKK
ncbi:PREDICTED: PR domain zinc finger protein 10-like, partial [Thamnophis sirtalis]|uniref:PR domain zinc finger protein 10-like n=1 Tax=Thamnophis sirtalis TaxID=35019 RepID=A0A6I9Y739_9SAUR